MTFQQELASWVLPASLKTAPVPEIGLKAPSEGQLQMPPADGKPSIVTFLRHCGCPFAEKTFKSMRSAADEHPDIHFIAISHSDKSATDKWLQEVGGSGKIDLIVDHERQLFGAWGLGASSFWHVLNPAALYNVYQLGKAEGIWNRPTESGSRWQTAGTFAIGKDGAIKWGGPAERADDIPDFEEGARSVS